MIKSYFHKPLDRPRKLPENTLSVMEKIQQLYPEVSLVDVPEDILYNAEKGPNVFGKLFYHDDLVSTIPPAGIVETSRLSMASDVELHRVLVTNAGAVYFDDFATDEKTAKPLFESSQMQMSIALNRRNLALHPLTPTESLIIRYISRNDCSLREARNAVLSQLTAGNEKARDAEMHNRWIQSLNHLLDMGLLQIEREGIIHGSQTR